MRFSKTRRNDFTISLDGLTLRNHAYVHTLPFVDFNDKAFISGSESWEKIQPNAQAAHIHLLTKFQPTIDVPTNFLSTVVSTNPIQPYDCIGRIQNFATTARIFTMIQPTAISKNTFFEHRF